MTSLSDFATKATLSCFCLFVLIFFLNNTFKTIYLDHILSFSPRYLAYLPTFMFFIPLSKRNKKSYRKQTTKKQQKRKKTQKHGILFVLGNYNWEWGLVGSVVVITEAKTLNKTGFSSPSRYQLQRAFWLGVGLGGHLPFLVLQLCLSWAKVSYMLSQSLWVPLCLKSTVSLESTTTGFQNLSSSSSS